MKNLLLILLFLSPFYLWAQDGTYVIKGKLGKINPTAKAYVRYVIEKTVYSDSSQIKDGKFIIMGKVDQPHYAWLSIDRKSIRFYLEPGNISVLSPDSIQNAVVSGSQMNDDDLKLKNKLKSTDEKMAQLIQDYKSFTPEQKKDKEYLAAFQKREELIFNEKNILKANFIKENQNSMLSLYILQQYTDLLAPEYSEVEPMFNQLSELIKNSKPGKEYIKKLSIIKATSIGAIAPDFTQPDTSGKAISLSSFRGKYVLIDFWASWCGPCRAENPNLVKNYQQYKDKNFTVLGVSLDMSNAKEAWLKAIHKDHLNWTHVSELKHWDSDVAKKYAVQLIPQNFLIGPDGIIIAKGIRGESLGKKLEELLGAKP